MDSQESDSTTTSKTPRRRSFLVESWATQDPDLLCARSLVPIHPLPTQIDPRDVGTPDDWVKRDPRLVRLTGKHPFNSEPRLNDLFAAGFLTPTELFYVRSHGAALKTDAPIWEIHVEGLVKTPISLSVTDLQTKFQVVTFPVTLVCAGNRRKEQNVHRKGLGFDWGAGGLSTALFTGVYLADILEDAGIVGRPRHVVFEGGDVLPQGPYGTSQPLSWARDKTKGMLIAWAMNGHALTPDHGFPVRLVVPGQIGGRSVKWLKKIIVSEQASQHHLHFFDNKVLPTQVSPDQAKKEKHWWYNGNYIITDLNVNSVVAVPDHNEILNLNIVTDFTMRGYAYAGGGRRVTRVELSLDDGDTWVLAEVEYPEDNLECLGLACVDDDWERPDSSFCWCFWSYKLSTAVFNDACSITVRAMDSAMALQPRDMYWNATSMMNNWWFRVAVNQKDKDTVQFEHPVMAGSTPGGWMQRMKNADMDILKPTFNVALGTKGLREGFRRPQEDDSIATIATKDSGLTRNISLQALEARRNGEEAWFVVNGEVYNATSYLDEHPGGPHSITLMAGKDATEDFTAIHSLEARAQLRAFHIGTLEKTGIDNALTVKDADQWKKVALASVNMVTHDTYVFRFTFQEDNQSARLPVGQHVYVRLWRGDAQPIQRAYTPISPPDETGRVDILVKIYAANQLWPEGGKMTREIERLRPDDTVEVKGPLGPFIWTGRGTALWRGKHMYARHIGMVCAGTGIAPIIQILRAILSDNGDKDTVLWLVDANKTEEDILFREELQDQVLKAEGRLHLHHVLSRATPSRLSSHFCSHGRINSQILASHLPPPNGALVLACGPDAMIRTTLKPALRAIGWDIDTQIVVF